MNASAYSNAFPNPVGHGFFRRKRGLLPSALARWNVLHPGALLAGALAIAAGQSPSDNAPLRTWTMANGKAFRAIYESRTGSQVKLRSETGHPLAVWIQDLSPGDRQHLDALRDDIDPALLPPQTPPEDRVWPETVTVDSRAVDTTEDTGGTATPPFRYRTRSFEFQAEEKLSLSVVREIARTFEATRALVDALPWDIRPEPHADPGFYRARLFASRESYIDDGAPERSSGVYSRLDRVFRVPFQSLGMERRGRTWFMQRGYSNDTVVHELTHQFMHDQLPFLTTAIIEGMAEYSSMLPYRAGVFQPGRHRSAIKEYSETARRRAGIAPGDLGLLHDLLIMPREEWAKISFGTIQSDDEDSDANAQFRLYYGAALLVYYFSHLDKTESGAPPLLVYLDRINEAARAWRTFLSSPGVRILPDGRIVAPKEAQSPTVPYDESHGLDHIGLLLRGRDAATLQDDMIAAFLAIGIPWN